MTRYEKKIFFFHLFHGEFLLKSEELWKSLLHLLAAKKRIACRGRSGTNSLDPEVREMVELEITIIIIIIIIIINNCNNLLMLFRLQIKLT